MPVMRINLCTMDDAQDEKVGVGDERYGRVMKLKETLRDAAAFLIAGGIFFAPCAFFPWFALWS